MSTIPSWLKNQLRCPVTGVELVEETEADGSVLVARPQGQEPIYYQVDNGVPVLLPER